jgi:hypothetical protein
VNALLLAIVVHAGASAVWAFVALLRHAQGKGISFPAVARYTRIVHSGPVEPRDPVLSAELEGLGFRPRNSYRGENLPLPPILQSWVDEPGTTECLLTSFVRGDYESRILCFSSTLADDSTRTTFGEISLPIFDDMPAQRMGFITGAIEPREILAGHRARLGAEASRLKPVSDDLEERAVRTRDYLEFQRSRGLLRLDAPEGKYVAERPLTLRTVRAQVFPALADLRAKPLLIGLVIACVMPAALLFLPVASPWLLVLEFLAVAGAGALAGWMFGPRFLPWSLILAAIPLYFAPAGDLWVFSFTPFWVAFLTHFRRLKKKRVIVKMGPPGKKVRNAILFWVVLVALFVAFFLYFRHPPR